MNFHSSLKTLKLKKINEIFHKTFLLPPCVEKQKNDDKNILVRFPSRLKKNFKRTHKHNIQKKLLRV